MQSINEANFLFQIVFTWARGFFGFKANSVCLFPVVSFRFL